MSSFFGDREEGRKPSDYWRIFRRYSLSIISIATLAGLAGFLIASSITPQYRSSASLMVKPSVAAQNNGVQSNVPFNMSSLYLTQLELIRSRAVAERVITKLNLISHSDFRQSKENPLQNAIRSVLGESLSEPIFGAKSLTLTSIKGVNDVIPLFNERLIVNSGGKSDFISISYDSGDPKMAASVANEIAIEYVQALTKAHQANINETIGWLAKRLDESRQSLVAAEAALRAFQGSSRVGDSTDEKRVKSSKLGEINSLLVQAQTKRTDIEIRIRQIDTNRDNYVALESLKDIADNPMVQKIREQEADLTKIVIELSQRYGAKHPKLIQAQSELEHVRTKKKLEIDRVIATIKKEYEYSLSNERAIKNELAEFQKESSVAKGVEFQLAKLEMEVATNRQIYDLLLTRLKEADLNKNTSMVDVRVVDTANPSEIPIKPDKKKIIGTALIAGLVLGFLLSLLRDSADTTFKTSEELVEKIGLPLLGVFPQLTRRDLGGQPPERVVAERPRSSVAESVNNIRTNVIFQAANDPPQVIMLTSAVSGEGKTTLSNNLAISLARLGPTLFLELDTRRPRMGALLGKGTRMGIFEFVTGKGSLKDCVAVERRIKNLYTMSVVAKPAKPLEFISSVRFKDAMNMLRTKFKYIVVDTPPVLPVSDSIVISSLVDGVIMVVGAESTKYAAVREAVSRMQSKNIEILGTVLSKGNRRTFRAYGKDYYYGYDKYYENDKGGSFI